MTNGSYTIDNHSHRFGAWAAGRAASVSTWRFSVETGRKLLEACGFTSDLATPDALPDATVIDREHANWRAAIKEAASAGQFNSALTDGTAAKLIGVYLKARFVCGGYANHPKVAALHPPIDKLLLDEMARHDFAGNARLWREASRVGWSNFDSQQYQDVIDGIRSGLGDEPMWSIEKFWRGHQ